MTKVFKVLMLAACAVAFTGFGAMAGEGDARPSYSLKKQGRPHFVKTDDAAEQDDTAAADVAAPSEIEPAAGGYEPEAEQPESKLADEMKLPRK